MGDLVLFRLQSGRVRVLEETVEAWQLAHAEAMRARAMEDLVSESLTFPDGLRAVWTRILEDVREDRIREFQITGQAILHLFDRAINLLTVLKQSAQKVASDTGHTVEGLDKLDAAASDLQQLRDHIKASWPWDDRPWPPLDRAMVEGSRADIAAGRHEDVKSVLERVRADGSISEN